MESLGSFILNTKKKFLTFSYKKKSITLQDVIVKPNSLTPENILDITRVALPESKKAIQYLQREVEKITTNKNEEVARLKDHNKKLLMQIRKLKKDKKSLENKVQQLVEKMNIDLVKATTQEEYKKVAKDTNFDVVVQTKNIINEGPVTCSLTSSPKENQIQTKKVSYRHLNHGRRQLNQDMYSE